VFVCACCVVCGVCVLMLVCVCVCVWVCVCVCVCVRVFVYTHAIRTHPPPRLRQVGFQAYFADRDHCQHHPRQTRG